ncbi:hypothetical protein KP509_10G041200 [Ceratopteris richardii]|uniref:YbaK/aminoacyl-tRNA synthetase-associated domain-containing protein n=1 Tax=Ceratopteris richardii TaxID=49495 RepID=A0A8T2U0E3_CERRI|nr:hypothetical protein KP509_10G041200 [Ceratopteris richardii]KAH7427377.1 hypothetical protein KP509_10G041200 [Ceratopteris richardii]
MASATELARLEGVQCRILERISRLESYAQAQQQQENSHQDGEEKHKGDSSSVEEALTSLLRKSGVSTFQFKKVPADYYDRTLEERKDLLGAASIDHLCKSIVMVNTQAHESVKDCSDFNNSKFYVVVIQYTARLNAEKVKNFVYSLNQGKIPKKRFNLRLAPEDDAHRLTGYSYNAVTPIGMRTAIPLILSDAILKLQPPFFWLGGGEVDLKLGLNAFEFVKKFNPFIVDCS